MKFSIAHETRVYHRGFLKKLLRELKRNLKMLLIPTKGLSSAGSDVNHKTSDLCEVHMVYKNIQSEMLCTITSPLVFVCLLLPHFCIGCLEDLTWCELESQWNVSLSPPPLFFFKGIKVSLEGRITYMGPIKRRWVCIETQGFFDLICAYQQ